MKKAICRISQYYYIIRVKKKKNMNQHYILSWTHVYGINVPNMNRTTYWMSIFGWWLFGGVKEKGWEKVS